MVTYSPVEFAGQIGLSASNMWGILKHIIDKCLDLDEGTYVLVKDASKAILRLYRVPEGALEEDRGDGDHQQDEHEGADDEGDRD